MKPIPITWARVAANLETIPERDSYWIGTGVALATGLLQFAVFFADNSRVTVLLLMVVVSLGGGALIGVFLRRNWLPFVLGACWGAAAAGLLVWVVSGALGPVLFAGAAASTLLGRAIGAGGVHLVRRQFIHNSHNE